MYLLKNEKGEYYTSYLSQVWAKNINVAKTAMRNGSELIRWANFVLREHELKSQRNNLWFHGFKKLYAAEFGLKEVGSNWKENEFNEYNYKGEWNG